jgi:hypothetical protein
MNPDQNRTGLASASSHDSQAVTSGSRAATQLDNSTLFPAPADPEFDDCTIAIGPDSTTLRAELPDQCAMSGLIQRIIDLRLEITRVLLLPRHDAGQGSKAAASAERQEEQPWSSH